MKQLPDISVRFFSCCSNFYHEISDHELFVICTDRLSDVPEMANIIKEWTHHHQELMDERL